jgi:hypothetical protein
VACLAGNTVSISYTVTDPGTDNFVLDHGVSWGDATTNTSLSHTYTSAGTFNISVQGKDDDGVDALASNVLQTTTANQVSLLYNVSMLQDPVNVPSMTTPMSVFKTGSTVPLKVIITDCNNQPVNGLAPKISFTKINPSTPVVGVNEALSTQPNDTNWLMRDDGNGQYIYNLSTKTLPDGDATYVQRNHHGQQGDLDGAGCLRPEGQPELRPQDQVGGGKEQGTYTKQGGAPVRRSALSFTQQTAVEGPRLTRR